MKHYHLIVVVELQLVSQLRFEKLCWLGRQSQPCRVGLSLYNAWM